METKSERQVDVSELREFLVYYFREKASYRRSVAARIAERQPWDVEKNVSYAESIERVADYVGALPDDDSALRQIAQANPVCAFAGMIEFPKDSDGNCSLDADAVHLGPRGSILPVEACAAEFASWAQCVISSVQDARRDAAEVVGDNDQSSSEVWCPFCSPQLSQFMGWGGSSRKVSAEKKPAGKKRAKGG